MSLKKPLRKKTMSKLPTFNPQEIIPNKAKGESMSLAGMANATAGSLATDGIKAIITPFENKPATKGDLNKLVAQINGRYHVVKNIPPRYDGALPYFDFDTNTVVYLRMNPSVL